MNKVNQSAFLAACLVLISGMARAQSTPSFYDGQIPTAQQWNAAFGSKQDLLPLTGISNQCLLSNPGLLPVWGSCANSTVGSPIIGGTPGGLLFDNGGNLGNTAALGSGVLTSLTNNLNASGGLVGYSGSLGTPAQANLANATGLPLATGVTGTLLDAQFPALTGDVSTTGGSLATTLATVNSGPGSVGSSTAIPVLTTNGKGLVTAQSTAAVVAPAGTLTGTALASNVLASSLTSVGTLSSGAVPVSLVTGLGAGVATALVDAPNTAGGFALYAAGMPRILGQNYLPMIVPSSGSMGANGALTLTTALDSTYAHAYLYMPANAISSGSAAGWYYGVGSSTTAFTLYNNSYSSGTPTIPGSPTTFSTTGPGAYTQTTSVITAYSLTVAANTFGATDGAEVQGLFTYPNSAGNKVLDIYFGSFVLSGTTATTSIQDSGFAGFRNRGATNAQAKTFTQNNFGTGTGAGGLSYGTVDCTASQSLYAALQLAVATDYVILQNLSVTYLPGVP